MREPEGESEGPDDVAYIERVQAGAWAKMLLDFHRFLGLPAGSRVIDAGCGTGLMPMMLSGREAGAAVGCDRSLPMVHRAAELHGQGKNLAFVASDLTRLPFADGVYDAATATNVLFLLADQLNGLKELVRVVRPGGVVAWLDPSIKMNLSTAERFASMHGLSGFSRYSFTNYGRLTEANHPLASGAWTALAERAGLTDMRQAEKADGLVLFMRGTK